MSKANNLILCFYFLKVDLNTKNEKKKSNKSKIFTYKMYLRDKMD